jgi:hypothetical protein
MRYPDFKDCFQIQLVPLHKGQGGSPVNVVAPNGSAESSRKGQAGQPCSNWAKKGTCSYGDKCRFSHAGAPDVPASDPEQAAMARIRLTTSTLVCTITPRRRVVRRKVRGTLPSEFLVPNFHESIVSGFPGCVHLRNGTFFPPARAFAHLDVRSASEADRVHGESHVWKRAVKGNRNIKMSSLK